MKPLVIDIYHGDPVEDFAAVKAFGIVGVIHKCTESTGYADPLYAHRRRAFTDLGLAWGAYHFYHGLGAAEADYFLARAEPDSKTLLALDWETTSNGYTPNAGQAKAFLQRIQDKLGRRAVVYSGHAAKEKISGKDLFFSAHRLWLAQFSTAWSVQASWDYPWLWQNNGDNYGPGPHHIPGIGSLCDNNTIVRGTVETLLAEWADGQPGPLPIPPRPVPPTPVPPSPTPPPALLSGRGSWYSQYRGKYHWVDTGDDPGSAALGCPDDAQGVSFYNHSTLGHWFEVHAPNGHVSIEQQTDIGPNPRTGRLIDISSAAAERFGYSPIDFPTNGVFKWRQIDPPVAVAELNPRLQAVRYRDLRTAIAQGE